MAELCYSDVKCNGKLWTSYICICGCVPGFARDRCKIEFCNIEDYAVDVEDKREAVVYPPTS